MVGQPFGSTNWLKHSIYMDHLIAIIIEVEIQRINKKHKPTYFQVSTTQELTSY